MQKPLIVETLASTGYCTAAALLRCLSIDKIQQSGLFWWRNHLRILGRMYSTYYSNVHCTPQFISFFIINIMSNIIITKATVTWVCGVSYFLQYKVPASDKLRDRSISSSNYVETKDVSLLATADDFPFSNGDSELTYCNYVKIEPWAHKLSTITTNWSMDHLIFSYNLVWECSTHWRVIHPAWSYRASLPHCTML